MGVFFLLEIELVQKQDAGLICMLSLNEWMFISYFYSSQVMIWRHFTCKRYIFWNTFMSRKLSGKLMLRMDIMHKQYHRFFLGTFSLPAVFDQLANAGREKHPHQKGNDDFQPINKFKFSTGFTCKQDKEGKHSQIILRQNIGATYSISSLWQLVQSSTKCSQRIYKGTIYSSANLKEKCRLYFKSPTF